MNTDDYRGESALPEDPELDSLYRAITGRQQFRYRADSDPLYRAAADRYVQNGRMAMRDTMGQAAALTGGYGSSYAQAAGQQRYDEYLRSLSEALPQYNSMAWQQYQAEGEALQNAYDLAWQRRESAYRRDRDAAADAAAAEQRDYSRRQDSYRQLYQLITAAGYEPADEELAAAGMSREQAEALRQQYLLAQQPKARSYGGSGSKSSKKKTDSKAKSGSVGAAVGAGAGAGTGNWVSLLMN